MILGTGNYFGGAELQMSILSKELVKRSYDVSFITFGKKVKFCELSEGVKVYTIFDPKMWGYPFLLPQNIYKLMKILHKIDADIYIKKGHTPLTGVVAFIAKLQRKILFFVASSEKDVSIYLNSSIIANLTNIFFRFGVMYADRIVCQTEHQKNLLKQHCDRNGVVIRNLYPYQKTENIKRDPQANKILWIGRLIKEKRPELFLDLVKKMPGYQFQLLMKATKKNPEYYNKIKKAASKINNVDIIGNVPNNEINKYYEKSLMLISTSISEGFPNTFLEAWGNSIPVVSIGFDPDEIICKYGLGIHIENFEDLVKNVDMLLKNDSLREKMGIQGRKYVEREHNVMKIVDEYEKLIYISQKIKNGIPK